MARQRRKPASGPAGKRGGDGGSAGRTGAKTAGRSADYAVIDKSGKHGFLYGVAQFVLSLFLMHYLLWWVLIAATLYLLHTWGPLGDLLVVLGLLVYLPSFLNADPFNLGRPWHWLRRIRLWGLVQNYLSLRVVRTAKLDPDTQYVFGYHPHGILVLSRIATYGNVFEELFPGIDFRVLGATPMFYVPGCREICLYMNAVDAGKKTANNVLAEPDLSVMVYPGGSKEIFTTDPNSKVTTLVLRNRFGFVKLAIRNGATLIPVFVFGEKFMYSRLRLPTLLRDFCLKKLRIPLMLFWGRMFSCMPKATPMSVVFGAPLDTPSDPNPSDEMVREVHARYMAAVEKLFHDHKADHGYGPDETLLIK